MHALPPCFLYKTLCWESLGGGKTSTGPPPRVQAFHRPDGTYQVNFMGGGGWDSKRHSKSPMGITASSSTHGIHKQYAEVF